MAAAKNSNSAFNDSRRQMLRAVIEKCLKTYFPSTLGKEEDMVNIFLAQIYLESHFNVDAEFKGTISPDISSGARDYQSSAAIQKILREGSPAQKANEPYGRKALGLSQSMGWNHIRGASKATGKCMFETIRKGEFATRLCVAPGDDPRTLLVGESNVENSILAGLAVLESKWLAVKSSKDGWVIGGMVFPRRISAAVAAYLGLGKKDVATGVTPQAYSASIVGGAHYLAANGAAAPYVRDSGTQSASSTSKGPTTTVASSTNPSLAGCVAKANAA